VRIETARLSLRELREDDAEAMARIFSHPSVVRFSGGRSPSLAEVREGIRQHVSGYYDDRGYGLLVAELRETREIVGRVGFLATEIDEAGRIHLFFDCSPEAPTVRGFAGILREGLEGEPWEEVLAVPPDFYVGMGLQEVVSALRLRGMGAILARLKRQIRENTGAGERA